MIRSPPSRPTPFAPRVTAPSGRRPRPDAHRWRTSSARPRERTSTRAWTRGTRGPGSRVARNRRCREHRRGRRGGSPACPPCAGRSPASGRSARGGACTASPRGGTRSDRRRPRRPRTCLWRLFPGIDHPSRQQASTDLKESAPNLSTTTRSRASANTGFPVGSAPPWPARLPARRPRPSRHSPWSRAPRCPR